MNWLLAFMGPAVAAAVLVWFVVLISGEPANVLTDEREQVRQQRDGELLRHISTLNGATIVLLLSLARPMLKANATLAQLMVGFFFVSLLCAVFGLFFHVAVGAKFAQVVRGTAMTAHLYFVLGLGIALLRVLPITLP